MSRPDSSSADNPALRRSLDVLARRGAGRLRHWHLRQSARDAWAWWPVALAAVPLGAFFGQLIASLAGPAPAPLSVAALAALAVAGPVLFVALAVAWNALRFRPSRAAALALHDRNAATQERLLTADEFLASPATASNAPEAPFMRAAIADAERHAEAAMQRPLPPIATSPRPVRRDAWWGALAALALIFATQFVGFSLANPVVQGEAMGAPALANADTGKPDEPARKNVRRPPQLAALPTLPEAPAEGAARNQPSRRLPRQEETMEGEPGSGTGSRAGSANAATPAAGMSPQRKNPPAPKKEQAAAPDAPQEEKTKHNKPKPRPQKSAEMAAEADSGQGQASSSSSSASPFEVPEHPDKTGQMLKGDVEDESEEDEDEQEDSNGANKPMTNQRDPAVDRNLSTRPPQNGDQPQNGRGGPGGLKKSRGVPSMILGIPVPDRVPGTVNPGRSKVTQEFTRPKEESHARTDALLHPPRSGMIGHLEQPELLPWRRALIENYFLSIREAMSPASAAPRDAEQ